MKPDYPSILQQIGKGKIADNIPALAKVLPSKFGIAIETIQGEQYLWGDATERFSIQSISKVFILAMALQLEKEKLWQYPSLR